MVDREAKIESLRYLNDKHGAILLVIARINGEERKVLIGENGGVNPFDGGLFVADGEGHEKYALDIEREVDAVIVLSSAEDLAEIQRQIAGMKMPVLWNRKTSLWRTCARILQNEERSP